MNRVRSSRQVVRSFQPTRWSLRSLPMAFAFAGCVAAAPQPTLQPAPVPLAATIDSILDDPDFRAAIIGVLVLDAGSGETLYSRNAHTALMPASNMKILTGAVALAQLGPAYRYRTTFALRGPVSDGTLHGDLLVFGRGDPSVSQRMAGNPLDLLGGIADSLRARGVTRVAGSLVHAGNAFTGGPYGYGWAMSYLPYAYGAGVDELLFNEGLSFDPAHPAGSDTSSSPPAAEPAAAYLDALRFTLNARGVVIEGATVRDSVTAPAASDIAFELVSPPFTDILAAMEKPSQNQIAEVVLRTIALEATGSGSDTAGARLVSEQLRAWGADTMEFVIRDGSGLSRHNLISPATVVRVLLSMREHEHFGSFHAALPAVGSEGTVRNWLHGTRASEVVRGKTGTLSMVRAFSGYATSVDGRQLVFSFIANHHLVPTPRVTTAIQGLLTTLTDRPIGP
jgi:serine-type D-Ala-D-Ala carboxypeptidase/endopeptidase (penicillin-binding protein 4)